jgi:hypothetical protein
MATCRIPGGFSPPPEASLTNTAEDIAPKSMRAASQCEQPIKGVVYPQVLDRQRRAAMQLLFVIDDTCTGDFRPFNYMCFTPLYGVRNTGCFQISTQKFPQIRKKKLTPLKHFLRLKKLNSAPKLHKLMPEIRNV